MSGELMMSLINGGGSEVIGEKCLFVFALGRQEKNYLV